MTQLQYLEIVITILIKQLRVKNFDYSNNFLTFLIDLKTK